MIRSTLLLIAVSLAACSHSSSSATSSSTVDGSGTASVPPGRAAWLAANPASRWADDVRAGTLERGMPRDVADATKGLGPESFATRIVKTVSNNGVEKSRVEHYEWPDGTEAWIEGDEVVRVRD